MTSQQPPITDSPWFWACLFASFGLLALWAIGPKYGSRQLREEHKAQGRLRAAEQVAQGEMTTEVSSEGNLAIPIRPLYGILSVLLMCAWGVLWWTHLRARPDIEPTKQNPEQQPSNEQGN